MTSEEYGSAKYQEYLSTPHWQGIRQSWIFDDPTACCYVCGLKVNNWYNGLKQVSNLVPHHSNYDNLYKEVLYRDIYRLCQNCHSQVHFWGKRRVKIPLKSEWLLFSMRLRKLAICIQKGRIGLSLLLILCILITALFNAFMLINKICFKILVKILGIAFR